MGRFADRPVEEHARSTSDVLCGAFQKLGRVGGYSLPMIEQTNGRPTRKAEAGNF